MEAVIGSVIASGASYALSRIFGGKSKKAAQQQAPSGPSAAEQAAAARASEEATTQRAAQDEQVRLQADQGARDDARAAEVAKAEETRRTARRRGGRYGALTFADTGVAGVTSGLATLLGGGRG